MRPNVTNGTVPKLIHDHYPPKSPSLSANTITHHFRVKAFESALLIDVKPKNVLTYTTAASFMLRRESALELDDLTTMAYKAPGSLRLNVTLTTLTTGVGGWEMSWLFDIMQMLKFD